MPETHDSFAPLDDASVSKEQAVLKGLTPRVATFPSPCDTPTRTLRTTAISTVPLLMTSGLTTGILTLPDVAKDAPDDHSATTERSDTRPGLVERLQLAMLPIAHTILQGPSSDTPATYTVQAGDTVSSIADRFGIPTAAVLTLNGLGWQTVLHPGQVLKLTTEPTKKRASSPVRVSNNAYVVQYGDSVSTIADRLGISTRSLLEHNQLSDNAAIFPGQRLEIPGATKATVSRQQMPTAQQAPDIVLASTEDQEPLETEQSVDPEAPSPAFDAADLPLAEKPTLITVRVGPKPAAPKKPAVAPAPAPSPAAEAPAASGSTGQPVTGTITPLNDERRANAQIIIQVGRELGVSDYGIVIALATAMQESSLRNINWGDRDSLGLYQQRPSSGWGTAEQIMDPAHSTRLFFGGPSNPNKGKTRGLLDIAGWQNMALTDAAQRVQISAYPQAYAKWEPSAWAWLYELT